MYPPHYSGYPHMLPPQPHPRPPPLHLQTQGHYPYSQHSMPQSPAPGPQPPPSPGGHSDAEQEKAKSIIPGPAPISRIWRNKIWSLQIGQQPQRARMCGFGDKDRRPISPPPCIKLIIFDTLTGQEVHYEDVDLMTLVISVDIYAEDGIRESNIVKHGNSTTCISSASTGPYPVHDLGQSPPTPLPRHNGVGATNANYPTFGTPTQASPQNHYQNGAVYPTGSMPYQNGHPYMNGAANSYSNPSPYDRQVPDAYRPQQHAFDSRFTATQHQTPVHNYSQNSLPPISQIEVGVQTSNTGSHQWTRNLIGSLCASAFKLKDEQGKMGVWFVLQDLSIRTDGWFRLKFNLFNLEHSVAHAVPPPGADAVSTTSEISTGAEKGPAPCLASVYSAIFKVYSAKKFPGVIESTPLSKCFAGQGIKIPIRKDTAGSKNKGGEDDQDDVEFEE